MLRSISEHFKDVSILRKIIFAIVHLPKDTPNYWEMVLQFAVKKPPSISIDEFKVLVENLQELDATAFSTDKLLLQELTEMQSVKGKPLGLLLISNNQKCMVCKSKLLLRKDRAAPVVIYDDINGSLPGTHFHKYCSNRSCKFTQYYGYYTVGGSNQVFFNSDWESLDYFVSSRETVFSINLLQRFNAEILIGQLSFMQCADIYNHLHNYTTELRNTSLLTERQKVDRRRVEDAFYQFALLKVVSWYPKQFDISSLAMHADTGETLSKMTQIFHDAFMQKYSAHRCLKSGCGKAIVLDGNMKNHRNVCNATLAGYAHFKGLDGQVQTGCPNTPVYKSSFCEIHKTVMAKPSQLSLPCNETTTNIKLQNEEAVGMIVNKRITRNSTLYQVFWLGRPLTETSWEPALSLPSKMVEEYESGVKRDLKEDFSTSGGLTVCTLLSAVQSDDVEPNVKKTRFSINHNGSGTSGVFMPREKADERLKCNTEKDKTRVKHNTSGILAGAYPCGTVVMIGELYGAESKSQVYGHLHTFLQENEAETKSIGFIIYDDGCHLKKYSINPSRATATTTTERITKMNIVIDRFHFTNHVDKWCRTNCNPDSFKELKEVDTETCEQIFSWLSKYSRITQHMNKEHFLFYILFLCDQRNQKLMT